MTREHRIAEKSLKTLEATFQELRAKIEEIDQHAIRDKKYDFPVMAQDELKQLIVSRAKPKKKTELLLTQIGYLRINLFGEYYEQVKQAQKKGELDKAVQLMNDYAETVAMHFIPTKRQQAWIKRLKKSLSIKSVEPVEFVQRWRTGYEAWLKQGESISPKIDQEKRMEKFNQLKMDFFSLYTYSFSISNFPSLRNRRSDH